MKQLNDKKNAGESESLFNIKEEDYELWKAKTIELGRPLSEILDEVWQDYLDGKYDEK